jgi:hypothetical protein
VLPPLVGVAVKVTLWPVQILLPALELIATDGVTDGFTVMVMLFELAVVEVTQAAFEVN